MYLRPMITSLVSSIFRLFTLYSLQIYRNLCYGYFGVYTLFIAQTRSMTLKELKVKVIVTVLHLSDLITVLFELRNLSGLSVSAINFALCNMS